MGFIGFGIYFCIVKSVDRVYGSYGPVVSGSTVDRPWEGGRSSPALSAPALWGMGDCCESLMRERANPRSSSRLELGGVVPAMERIGDGGRSSMGTAFRARRGGDDDGNEFWRSRPGCCALL
jgi:hypothetical protein